MEKTDLALQRERLLEQVKNSRASATQPTAEDDNLEQQLADLWSTLPTTYLTADMLATGATFVGFLYNIGFENYVAADGDDKWLYAYAEIPAVAIRWTTYQDSVGNIVFTATVGATQFFFNWRNETGACKLYDSYDAMALVEWTTTSFRMRNQINGEEIGTWSTDDNELYNRLNVSNLDFQFLLFNQAAFDADDKLIFDAYLKWVPDFK